jgi:hypothetical protein
LLYYCFMNLLRREAFHVLHSIDHRRRRCRPAC